MAITNEGTQNSLSSNNKPDGYSDPVVSTFTDHEYISDLSLSVLKATVENATATTTMANIIANGTIGITKQIDDILAADYLATATVTAYADWIGISHNLAAISGNAPYLQATAISYVCTVKLYVKTS